MSDSYADVRSIPLRATLSTLGYTEFRKRSGKDEWFGACPLHNPEKNKTSFSFTDKVWNCFSCGQKGSGSIDLYMALKKVGFRQAVDELRALNPSLPADSQSSGENKVFTGRYEKFYQPCPWLEARIPKDMLELYGVGLYHNPARQSVYAGKVLLPVRRFSDGEKVGYLARNITPENGEPKYIFPNGFHKQLELWGAWQLKEALLASGQERLPLGFVVESPFCVMKFRSLGFHAVSPFGAHLSVQQVEMVSALFHRVVLLPDAGLYGAVLASDSVQLLAARSWVRVPQLPEGIQDPEVLSEAQILELAE